MRPSLPWIALAVLVVLSAACSDNPTRPTEGDDASLQASGGAYRVMAVGDGLIGTVPREVVGRFNERTSFHANVPPSVSALLPADFDFRQYDVLVWLRSARGPFGAGTPRIRGVSGGPSEFTLDIEWHDECAGWGGLSYALLELPRSSYPTLYWRVAHHAPKPPAAGARALTFTRVAAPGVSNSLTLERDERILAFDSREEYLAFVDEYEADVQPALFEVDFRAQALVLLFGTPGLARSFEAIERDGDVVNVFASNVLQHGPVPAVTQGRYEAAVVPRDNVGGVREWAVIDDGAPEARAHCAD